MGQERILDREEVFEEILDEVVSGETLDHERCSKQLVQNAAKNAKFHSNPLKASLSFAENVIEKREDFNFYFFNYSSSSSFSSSFSSSNSIISNQSAPFLASISSLVQGSSSISICLYR